MTDNNHYDEFSKTLIDLGRTKDLSRIFNDFLTMGICAYHKTNIQSGLKDKDESNEALYMRTIKPYSKDELNDLSKCLALLKLNTLEKPYSDPLGEFFMQEISRGHNGQYFTPEHICELMARLQLPDEEFHNKRILDPACGSGRMLLSAAKLNHKNLFFGADNSQICSKMAVLNFLVNGLTGEIAWMNSLSMEWYGGWHINSGDAGILPIDKEQSIIWMKPPEPKPVSKLPDIADTPSRQLTLF